MPDLRSYHPNLSPDQPEIALSSEESQHLVAANRGRNGDPVTVFDGEGREWECDLVEADKRSARLLGRSFTQHSPPNSTIALAQAIPKGKGLEAIVRKATELGIQSVYPLVTNHTEMKIKADRAETKSEKWKTAAIEGAKQSGNPFIPKIHAARGLEQLIEETADSFAIQLVASLQPNSLSTKQALGSRAPADSPSALILIGPEGDFSDREYAAIAAARFQPITLGPHVLKCETAAVAALSILRHELG